MAEYELVMPFVVCESHGGPYEDQAFTAGYELGLLDARLGLDDESFSATLKTDSGPQIDLIAMRNGFQSSVEEIYGEWTSFKFEKTQP